MKKSYFILFFTVCLSLISYAQNTVEEEIELYAKPANLYGTILCPDSNLGVVALIISGSGPTDRDGNSAGMSKNNSLKYLAEDLSKQGIASLRIDKRGVGKSLSAMKSENELTFDVYIDDIINWGYKILNDRRFKKLVIIGHSEGSLVGMAATKELEKELNVLGYVSLAGAGYPIDEVIMKQLKTLPDSIQNNAKIIFEKLKNDEKIKKVDPNLISLFRPSIQNYMASWVKLNPKELIKEVNAPILIVNGTTDIQVPIDNAEALHAANPKSEMVIVEGMNHVFKEAPADREENIKTYTNPDLKNMPKLADSIVNFIKSNL